MLRKGKLNLTLNHPFFATVALRMPYIEDNTVGTISIGRDAIRYNSDFINSLKVYSCAAVLAHEVLHYLLHHHIRGIGKDPNDWNIACDYVVNAILRKYNFQLPPDHLYDPMFEGMDAEQVYRFIHKEEQENQQQNKPENGDNSDQNESEDSGNSDQNESEDSDEQGDNQSGGNGTDDELQDNSAPQNWGKIDIVNESEAKEAEAEAKEVSSEALSIGKQAGDIAGNIMEKISTLIEPQKYWYELLQKYLAEKAKNDYSWSRPNYRYIPLGVYLPSLDSLEIGGVVFAIDTSISMNEMQLRKVVSEIKEAMKIFNFPVTVIHCDREIRLVEELEEDNEIVPVGRGGTSFIPVFKYVEENLPETKVLIYFTDGECYDDLKEPEFETLWIIDNIRRNYNPKFGEVIYMD
jgi:predicted metal-dependent peptidase